MAGKQKKARQTGQRLKPLYLLVDELIENKLPRLISTLGKRLSESTKLEEEFRRFLEGLVGTKHMTDYEKYLKAELRADRAETRQLAKWGTGLFAVGIGGAILACGEFKKAGIDSRVFGWAPIALGIFNVWLQVTVNLRSRRIRRDMFPNASEEVKKRLNKRTPGLLGMFFVLFPLVAGIAGSIGLMRIDPVMLTCPHYGKVIQAS